MIWGLIHNRRVLIMFPVKPSEPIQSLRSLFLNPSLTHANVQIPFSVGAAASMVLDPAFISKAIGAVAPSSDSVEVLRAGSICDFSSAEGLIRSLREARSSGVTICSMDLIGLSVSGHELELIFSLCPDLCRLIVVLPNGNEALRALVKHSSKLECLVLEGCKGVRDASVIQILQKNPNLSHLDLTGCDITDATIFAAYKYGKKLTTLKLDDCRGVSIKNRHTMGPLQLHYQSVIYTHKDKPHSFWLQENPFEDGSFWDRYNPSHLTASEDAERKYQDGNLD